MENTGFNLMAGFIAATAIIMGITMYSASKISNAFATDVVNSYDTMSTMEKGAFNNQFTSYEGTQSGNKVKALIGVLIANSNAYKDEVEKIPSLTIGDKINSDGDEVEDATIESEEELNNYVLNLGRIREKIETNHTYTVEIIYNIDGIVSEITIYYEEQ